MANKTLINVPKDAVKAMLSGPQEDAQRHMSEWLRGCNVVWLYDGNGVRVSLDEMQAAVSDPANWQDSTFTCGNCLKAVVADIGDKAPGVCIQQTLFEYGRDTFRTPISQSSDAGVTDLIVTLPHEFLHNPENWRAD